MSDRLDRQITSGLKAEQELRDYGGRLGELQRSYLSELLLKARKGEETTASVYKLVALDDLVMDLRGAVTTGKKAYAKREEKRLNEER